MMAANAVACAHHENYLSDPRLEAHSLSGPTKCWHTTPVLTNQIEETIQMADIETNIRILHPASTIAPIRPFDEADAPDWLRAQPGGRTTLPAAELGRRWGWPRQRTGRRLAAWAKAGLVKRRGNTIAAVVDGASVTLVPSDAPVVAAAPVRCAVPPHVPPAVPLPPTGTAPVSAGIDVAAYTAAVGLAVVAAFFSIRGMVVLFPGAPLLIIAMATMMEASKLVAVGWLARRWCSTAWAWRLTLGPVLSCATFSRERIRIKHGTPLFNLMRPYGRGIQIRR
jgi:hypothetical protein